MDDEVQRAVDRVWDAYHGALEEQVTEFFEKSLPGLMAVDESPNTADVVRLGPSNPVQVPVPPTEGFEVTRWELVPNISPLFERRWQARLTSAQLGDPPEKQPKKLAEAVVDDMLREAIGAVQFAPVVTAPWVLLDTVIEQQQLREPARFGPLVLVATAACLDVLEARPKLMARLQPIDTQTCSKLPVDDDQVTALIVRSPMSATFHARLRPTLTWDRDGTGAVLTVTERSTVSTEKAAPIVALTGVPPAE
jgi:hypothetical protein